MILVSNDTFLNTYKFYQVCNQNIVNVVLVIALLTIFLAPGTAQAKYASIVVDAENGKILHATNIDTRNYPASLTKMMTLFMIFEALNSGKWTLGSKLKISARAARQPASRLGLKTGQSITVKDAILALVTKSANDVATAVAENLAGNESNFALMMTAAARKLNMNRTTFRNASGLPHRGQMSTARDMAKLGRALLQLHHRYYHYFSVDKFRFRGRTYKNHNQLLTSYRGTDGIKTGYIRASGYNLVASAIRGNKRLIGVIFGGQNSKHRNRLMTKILNKSFSRIDKKLNKRSTLARVMPKKKKYSSVKTKQKISDPRIEWGIQVGAYAKYSQAHKAAHIAIGLAKRHLVGAHVKILTLKTRRGKTLYRARIHGLKKKSAYAACRLLEKKSRDCMEFSIKNLQLAANTN